MKNKTEFELQLQSAVKKACERDIELLEKMMKNYSYTFSTEFEQRMNDMIEQQRLRKIGKRSRSKYILIAAAILLMNAAIVMANDELRAKFGNLMITIYEDCVELKNGILGGNKKKKFERYSLQYLPKGYQIIEEKYNEPIEWIVMYANETDNIILYTQLDSDVSDVLITYDGSLIEEISIRGNEAWIISDGDFLTILFEKDGYTFTISSQESKSELIKMSEYISILKN